jgi:hypothetical protein
MNSLPTVNQNDYWIQEQHNNELLVNLLQQYFPTITIPFERLDFLMNLMGVLAETNINPQILPRVIRGVNNILIGTGKGQVIVHVCKESMNVSVREQDEEMNSKERG